MKLFIFAKPGAKEDSVKKIDDTHFTVTVKEPPIQGRANKAIIKTLAEFLGISPSRLNMVLGHTNKQKVIEII